MVFRSFLAFESPKIKLRNWSCQKFHLCFIIFYILKTTLQNSSLTMEIQIRLQLHRQFATNSMLATPTITTAMWRLTFAFLSELSLYYFHVLIKIKTGMIGNSVIIWKIILVGMGFSIPLSALHNIDTHAHLLGAGLGPKHMNSNRYRLELLVYLIPVARPASKCLHPISANTNHSGLYRYR